MCTNKSVPQDKTVNMKRIVLAALFAAMAVAGCASAALVPFSNATVGIVNGKDAERGQFPHQVSLRYRGSHRCGGSIITSRWILTAAHCTEHIAAKDLVAVVGAILLQSDGVRYQIEVVKNHPKFVPIRNDIAALKTATEIEFSDVVKAIALPTENVAAGVPVTVSGWGRMKVSGERILFSSTRIPKAIGSIQSRGSTARDMRL